MEMVASICWYLRLFQVNLTPNQRSTDHKVRGTNRSELVRHFSKFSDTRPTGLGLCIPAPNQIYKFLFRPADKLSLNQSVSLTATGAIWSRYSMVVIPKNWVLFSVNFALAITGLIQVARILHYQSTDEYKNLQAAA